jgi:hypothetical protein
MQATDTRLSHRPVLAMGASSCSYQRSRMLFARSDEISLGTWLCAALRFSRNFGHNVDTEAKWAWASFVPGHKRHSAAPPTC